MPAPPRTLVLGVGNPLRRDDAAGWSLASQLEALAVPGVDIRCVQQLQVEMAETWSHYERVVVLDAAVSGGVGLHRLPPTDATTPASSHALSPGAVLALSQALFDHTPEVWVCAIPATDFSFGPDPSPAMRAALDLALSQVRDLLQPRTNAIQR